jgi:hypothetical protein
MHMDFDKIADFSHDEYQAALDEAERKLRLSSFQVGSEDAGGPLEQPR